MKFGTKRLYINGELRPAADKTAYEIVCPGNEEVIAKVAWANDADTEEALRSAQEGFNIWSKLDVEKRLEWIQKLRQTIMDHEDLLRSSIMYEMGKVWDGTGEDFKSLTDSLQYYSEEITKRKVRPIEDKEGTHLHKIVSQPLGVVVAFLSYNFPLLNLGFKLGPALAAGCSIIIKPSEFSPLSAYILGEICHKIGFPAGVINIICGEVEDVGIPLCESTIPKLITMIGSTETAQKLVVQSSATSIKRFNMECGGNAPFIVFPDADLDLAVDIGASLKIGNSGQICVAPNRFFIHNSVLEEYIQGLKVKFTAAKVGFGRENKPDLGPLANKQSVTKVDAIVRQALTEGGELIMGGSKPERKGFYYDLTIILIRDPHAEVLHQEIFGPVAFVVPFETQEEVLAYANSTSSGLASYVFSSSRDILDLFARDLEFGEVQLNGIKYDIYLPHGGVKNSGMGFDCSTFALDDYLIKKRVSMAMT